MRSEITKLSKANPFQGMKWLVIVFVIVMSAGVTNAQVAINNDNSAPNASAMLDVKATGLGFLAPRMTFAQRPAAPATGLLIYQTDLDFGYYYFDGAAWQKVGRAGSDYWLPNGSDIYFSAGGAAIGRNSPDLHGLYSEHYVAGAAAVKGTDESTGIVFADGMLGVLAPSSFGVPIEVFNVGVLGIKPNTGFDGAGVYGWSNDTDALNYAAIFAADGESSNTNYAIYADADNAATNYAGYFKGRVHVRANDGNDYGADSTANVFVSEVTHNQNIDTRAIYGISIPTPGYGYGVYGEGGYRGIYGFGNGSSYTGTTIGVYGYSSGTAGSRYGVYGYAYNTGTSAIGVYGYASGATTNWAGYFSGDCYISSDLRIGTTTQATGYSLSVAGKIACEEILIDDDAYWPDYVFDGNYNLLSIDEFENSINTNKHLPGMPSAQEISENGGYHVGDIQKKTLEKVEELSLYIIELNNRLKAVEKENQELKAQISNR
jgi:hypothetical protein